MTAPERAASKRAATDPWRAAVARARELLPHRADWTTARRSPRRNLLAGVTVAIVALPLALAFGETSGLGARAGIVTAIVAGALAAIFGGSNLQVSGPTGAMTVVLVPIIHRFGPQAVLMVGLMAGVALIAMAGARLGRFVRLIPAPVFEGFTAGIAVVIALQQVPAMLGTTGTGDKAWQIAFHAVRAAANDINLGAVAMTVAVTAVILIGVRLRPGLPFSLIAVIAATLVATLTSLDVAEVGALPAGLPRPSLSFIDAGAAWTLASAALAVAALAALESLLSATVADGMTVSQRHDPDRELFGQGIANMVAPMFGGVPATAAIARTAVNVRAGANSRLAALTHAVGLMVIVSVASRWVGHIPLAALAGVLIATSYQMIEVSALRAMARASRQDGAILAVTFLLTVAVDLVTAVGLGIAAAVVLALRSVSASASIQTETFESTADFSAEQHALLREHVVAFRLEGPLFFAAAHRFLLELTEIADVRIVILRMSHVTAFDTTGARVLGDAIEKLQARGTVVLLSGADARQERLLTALGTLGPLKAAGRVFPDTPSAIAHAHELLESNPPQERAAP